MSLSREQLESVIARMEASNRAKRADATPVKAAGFVQENDNDDGLPSIRHNDYQAAGLEGSKCDVRVETETGREP